MSIDALAYAKTLELGEAECAQARLLLYVLAENTFNDNFVCKLCQAQLAYEAGRVSDRTIRRHMDALEAARIIIRSGVRRRSQNTGHLQPDTIRIVGFKRWYIANNSRLRRPSKAFGKSPADNLSAGQSVRKPADNSSPQACGQQVSGTYKEARTYSRTSSPSPQAGCSDVDDFGKSDGASCAKKAERALERVSDLRGSAPVIAHLLSPLVGQRRFSASDHVAAMTEIVEATRGWPSPRLGKVLSLCLESNVHTVKMQRVRDAIEAVRKAGLMIVISRREQPSQWAAWLKHFEQKSDSGIAGVMRRSDKWQVPSEWPPSTLSSETVAEMGNENASR